MTRTISVVCGVMDRMGHLSQALPTWLACPEVTEVVIVDWSSSKPLPNCARDPRVRVVMVDGQSHWHASKCHNLGLRLARGELVLRLDADDLLVADPEGRTFFDVHEHAGDNSFFRLDKTTLRESDQVHLVGVIYARKKDLLGVGGYNERVRFYGHEDDDLVARLAASGAKVLDLDTRVLHHLTHSDSERVLRVPLEDYPELTSRPEEASWTWSLGAVERSIEASRRVAKKRPWTNEDEMATFDLSVVGRTTVAREVVR